MLLGWLCWLTCILLLLFVNVVIRLRMSALQPQRRRLLQATPLWPTSRRNCRTSSEPRPAKLWTRECRKIWFPRQHEDLIAELISLTLERRLYILGISSSHRNKLAELSYMWSLGGIDCRIKHIYPYSIYVHNSSLKVSNLVLTSNLLMNPDAKSILQSSLTIIILSSFLSLVVLWSLFNRQKLAATKMK